MGDHGYFYHGEKLYQEQLRIPLIIVGESIAKATKIDNLVRSIDIVPTILDILGYPPEKIPADIDGESLRNLWDKQGDENALSRGGDRVGYSESSYPKETYGRSPIFSVIDNDIKFIYHPESREDNELFDLSADKAELNNIISERPELARELLKEINRLQAGTVLEVEHRKDDGGGKSRSLLKSLGYLN